MNRFTSVFCFLAVISAISVVPLPVRAQETLPRDVDADSRNRLPLVNSSNSSAPAQGAAAIRLHGSGVAVRWSSSLGRALTELAILTSAREHDQPYEWSLHELEAMAVGLDPAVIDVVKHRKPCVEDFWREGPR